MAITEQYLYLLLLPFCLFSLYSIITVHVKISLPEAIIGSMFMAFSIFMLIYMLTRLARAKLQGDVLILKRMFRKEEHVQISKIQTLRTFRNRGILYLTFKYNTEKSKHIIWIMKPFIFSKGSNVEQILRFAMIHYKSGSV